jgi:hypothetical protein
MVQFLAVVATGVDGSSSSFTVQERNVCSGGATVVATLDAHGVENRTMPDGSVRLEGFDYSSLSRFPLPLTLATRLHTHSTTNH